MNATVRNADGQAVKFCKDCHWYQAGSSVTDDRCVSPENIAGKPDIVRGEIKRLWTFCDFARQHACGLEAKWFEPKAANPEALTDATNGESQGAEAEGAVA